MGIVVVASLAANAEAKFPCDDYRDPSANQFGRQRRQSVVLALCPAGYDGHVLALDIAGFFQALVEYAQRSTYVSSDAGWRNPITGIAGCCARAASGHAAAAPLRRVMNSRRFTARCLPCFRQKDSTP